MARKVVAAPRRVVPTFVCTRTAPVSVIEGAAISYRNKLVQKTCHVSVKADIE